jgi:hypothetical protein
MEPFPADTLSPLFNVGFASVWKTLPTMDEFIQDLSYVPPAEADVYHYPEYASYIEHPV